MWSLSSAAKGFEWNHSSSGEAWSQRRTRCTRRSRPGFTCEFISTNNKYKCVYQCFQTYISYNQKCIGCLKIFLLSSKSYILHLQHDETSYTDTTLKYEWMWAPRVPWARVIFMISFESLKRATFWIPWAAMSQYIILIWYASLSHPYFLVRLPCGRQSSPLFRFCFPNRRNDASSLLGLYPMSNDALVPLATNQAT